MLFQLGPHPQSQAVGAQAISVRVAHAEAGMRVLTYRLHGDISALRIPEPRKRARANQLWEHMCFEAFVRPDGDTAYFEFNFSPSGQWAAYRLSGYRSAMVAAEVEAPAIEIAQGADWFELRATLSVPWTGKLGLSAIIEDKAGRKSWWALAHPPGDADFHDAACFAAELPPAEAP